MHDISINIQKRFLHKENGDKPDMGQCYQDGNLGPNCSCFVGENRTPVSIIWVQIKFRKIGFIDNYLFSIEKKLKFF